MEVMNIFDNLPLDLSKEVCEQIASKANMRIERIVSSGHVTPDGSWYDQVETEWVLLLQGYAEILFANESTPRQLHPGDHLLILPHHKHRVVKTSSTPKTIWLAVFY
jgi:cupin 2 domain-containing protein